jgi:hypothetical protein
VSFIEVVSIAILLLYAVYRQTHVAEVKDRGRFTLAIVYAVVGVCVGGFTDPHRLASVVLLAASILLSVVVGVARSQLTRVWLVPDGRVMRRGTALTVGLFLGMVAVKFAIGAYADLAHLPKAGGFGEVMVMMAIMVAIQAELIKRRAARLRSIASTVPLRSDALQPSSATTSAGVQNDG